MKRIISLILSCWAFYAYAQEMGSFKNYTTDGNTVTINSTNGQIVISRYADYGWKVTTLPEGKSLADERKSITLIGSPKEGLAVSDDATEFVISAGNASVVVNKQTSLLSFMDNGVVRLSEKTCLDNASEAKTVTFVPQNENGFYGGGYNGRFGSVDGQTLRMNNTQKYNWDQEHKDPNNICVPFIVSTNGYGVLFEDHYIDATIKPSSSEGIQYSSQSPTPISYVYVGSEDGTQAGVMKTYGELTGTHELPPYWALGYITSRYGYHSQQETEGVIASLEQAKMPVSGVVLDLFWEGEKQNGMGNLDWYKPNWPDASQMMNNFKKKGIHTVIITEPYFAEESANYLPLLNAGLFADPECPNMTWVSDNKVGIIDFMNPASIDWYWNFYKARTEEGVDGWWLDLGEPEMITEGTIHADGSTHPQAHNEFGQKWIEGVWNKWKQEYPNKRPIFLPRSGTSGMQRYATFPWTGDIARSWSGMKCQVPALINGGMSGLGYLSSDIGGFVADQDNTDEKILNPELYMRWFQMGIYTPVLRTHGQYLPEPYQQEYSQYASILSDCLAQRYKMLPYIYSASWLNTTQNTPITAPVNFYTDEDKSVANLDDEYLFGPNMLIAPITEPGAKGREVVLPSGEWVDFATLKDYDGNQTIEFEDANLRMPVFLRRGTFTPYYAQTEYSNIENINRSKLQVVYPLGKDDAWDFTLYDDDHESAQVGDKYELITFSGKYEAGSHVITINQQCKETYENRPAVREIDFVVPLYKDQKVTSVTSNDISITDQMYFAEDGVLTFHASVPAKENAQSAITINFDDSNDIRNVQVKDNGIKATKKYLLNDCHIVIEKDGHRYNTMGIGQRD